jgi:hypothetical protein
LFDEPDLWFDAVYRMHIFLSDIDLQVARIFVGVSGIAIIGQEPMVYR